VIRRKERSKRTKSIYINKIERSPTVQLLARDNKVLLFTKNTNINMEAEKKNTFQKHASGKNEVSGQTHLTTQPKS
jgi:protein tyrosine/serine phosphatase